MDNIIIKISHQSHHLESQTIKVLPVYMEELYLLKHFLDSCDHDDNKYLLKNPQSPGTVKTVRVDKGLTTKLKTRLSTEAPELPDIYDGVQNRLTMATSANDIMLQRKSCGLHAQDAPTSVASNSSLSLI